MRLIIAEKHSVGQAIAQAVGGHTEKHDGYIQVGDVQHARLGRNYDALIEQTADALIFFAGKVDHHSRGSRHKTGNVVEHRLAAPKYAILPAARGRRQAATAKTERHACAL